MNTLRPSGRLVGALVAAVVLLFSLSRSVWPPMAADNAPLVFLCLLAGCALVYVRGLTGTRRRIANLFYASSWRSFYITLFVAGVLFYAAMSWILFDATPHLDDDVTSLFQARLFASGRLSLPLHPYPEFFWQYFVLGPRVGFESLRGMYPPGHPALLTPGVLVGAPWLVTPVLGGSLVVCIAALGRQLYGLRTGRLAGLFALGSPFVTILSASHLSHVPTALFCTLSMWATSRLMRTANWRFGVLAGCALSVAFLCRPLTAVVMGLVIALGPLSFMRSWPRWWKGLLCAILPVVVAVAVQMLWQHMTTGDFMTPGHKIGMGRRAKFGFGVIDWVRTHTPAIGLEYVRMRFGALNEKTLGFPLPAYLLALLPILAGRARKADLWLLLPSLALLLTYFPYWYYEEHHPARYIFSGVPMLLVLCARGYGYLEWVFAKARSARVRRLPQALLASCLCFLAFVFHPRFADGVHTNHGDVEPILPQVIEDYGMTNAVVFMDSLGRLPFSSALKNDFYATGFMRNNLAFDGDVIYARNLREKNHLLAAMHPERDLYLYRYERERNKAYLYRLAFDGEDHLLSPVPPRTRDLLPAPPVD